MDSRLFKPLDEPDAPALCRGEGSVQGLGVQHSMHLLITSRLVVAGPGATSSFLLLIAMPCLTSSFLLLVAKVVHLDAILLPKQDGVSPG